jgi:5-methylcytosine-specific restriction enzyme subunit McrC
MNKKKSIIAYEFGTFYIEGQSHNEGDIPLSESTFNNLWDFILSSKATDGSDTIMSVHKRGGRRYIKTGRYVGTIQTKNGQTIEILPKIYKASGQQEKDVSVCRNVFLNMLKHFTDFKARSFQNASLNTKKGFPILEVYISNYIRAVEELLVGGLKKSYALVEENQYFLKGKLDIGKQITKNITNKARFVIRYNKYIENIPQNRVIVTTLKKLLDDSHSTTNKAHISALLTILADIPSCTNIENDLRVASSSNRLFASYDMILKWSEQFLLNRGFTTFAGSYVNQSLLFQAEKLFESFIAYLFKKYAPTYNVNTQNTRYFLVDNHNGKGMFRLKPDILVESDKDSPIKECFIIDTKWKAIDSNRLDKNYLIDIKDMYQLYAYGQKYKQGESFKLDGDIIPKLVLIYPASEKFTEKLEKFEYDSIGLQLFVFPFDLSEPTSYKDQIKNILDCLITHEIMPIGKREYDKSSIKIPSAAESSYKYE